MDALLWQGAPVASPDNWLLRFNILRMILHRNIGLVGWHQFNGTAARFL
jgi:hypothetical protein